MGHALLDIINKFQQDDLLVGGTAAIANSHRCSPSKPVATTCLDLQISKL